MVAGARALDGVTSAEASALDHRLVIRYDPERMTEAKIAFAVDRIVERVAP